MNYSIYGTSEQRVGCENIACIRSITRTPHASDTIALANTFENAEFDCRASKSDVGRTQGAIALNFILRDEMHVWIH